MTGSRPVSAFMVLPKSRAQDVSSARGHVVAGVALVVAADGLAGVRVAFEVENRRQRVAVGAPAAAVLDEDPRLVGAGGRGGVGEMVGAADHANGPGSLVLVAKRGAGVVVALGGLDVGEAGAHVPLCLPVDAGLVLADVESLDAEAGHPGAFRGQCLGGRCRCPRRRCRRRRAFPVPSRPRRRWWPRPWRCGSASDERSTVSRATLSDGASEPVRRRGGSVA